MYQNKKIITVVIIGAVAAVGLLIVIIVQQGPIFQALRTMVRKLYVINDSSGSRYEAIFTDLRIFLEHPLFGGRFAETLNAVKHNTSSTLLLYAVYGIGGGTLNLAAWVALVWKKERKLWLNLLLLTSLVMAVNTQNFTTDVFFWLFPTVALVERGVPLLTECRLMKKKVSYGS